MIRAFGQSVLGYAHRGVPTIAGWHAALLLARQNGSDHWHGATRGFFPRFISFLKKRSPPNGCYSFPSNQRNNFVGGS